MDKQRLEIWAESSYTKTPWYQEMMSGLRSKLSPQVAPLYVRDNPPDNNEVNHHLSLVLLACETFSWINRMIHFSQQNGIRVCIISSTPIRSLPHISSISLDRENDMLLLCHYFVSSNRKRIALWGINPSSPTDSCRVSGYLKSIQAHGLATSEKDIYASTSNVNECAERLLKNIENYDGIIASNDLYAIYLMGILKQRGYAIPDRLWLAAFGNTTLSTLCVPTLTTTTLNHFELGRQAAKNADYLLKNPDVSCSTVEISSYCHVRDSTANTPFTNAVIPSTFDCSIDNNSSYNDSIIRKLAALEVCLNTSDKENIQILKGIMSPDSLEDLADKLFMSEGSLRYRLGNLYSFLGIPNRHSLSEFLSHYAPQLKKPE